MLSLMVKPIQGERRGMNINEKSKFKHLTAAQSAGYTLNPTARFSRFYNRYVDRVPLSEQFGKRRLGNDGMGIAAGRRCPEKICDYTER